MSRQHVHVRAAAEPQQPQRQLDLRIVAFDRIGDVAVLMGPRRGARQRANALDEQPAAVRRDFGVHQRELFDAAGDLRRTIGRQSKIRLATIRPQRLEKLLHNRLSSNSEAAGPATIVSDEK